MDLRRLVGLVLVVVLVVELVDGVGCAVRVVPDELLGLVELVGFWGRFGGKRGVLIREQGV